MQEVKQPIQMNSSQSFPPAGRSGFYSDGQPRYAHSPSLNASRAQGPASTQGSTGLPYSVSGRLQQEASPNAEQINSLQAQLHELRRDLARKQQEIDTGKSDLDERQGLLRFAAGEARREVLALRELKEQSAKKLSAAEERIQELEAEVAVLSTRVQVLEAGQRDSQSQEAPEDDGKQDSEDRLLQFQNQLINEQEERTQLQEQVVNLESSAAKAAALRGSLEQQLEDVMEQCAQLADLNDQGEARVIELVAELMALRDEAANGADRITDLEQRCLDLQSSLDDAKRQIYQLGRERDSQSSQMEEASKQLIKISAEMAEVKSARSALQAQVDNWTLSDEGASTSNEPTLDLEPVHDSAGSGLAALLGPRLPVAGLHSPERSIAPRTIPFSDTLPRPEASRQGPRGGLPHASDETEALRTQSGMLVAELVAAGETLRRLVSQGLDAVPEPESASANTWDEAEARVLGEASDDPADAAAAVSGLRAALAGLEQVLNRRSSAAADVQGVQRSKGSRNATMTVLADGSHRAVGSASAATPRGKHRFTQGIVGGLIIVPALVVAGLFLPKTSGHMFHVTSR